MEKRLSYSEKLKDPRWQKKRLEVLNRDEFRCIVCTSDCNTLHVHHIHYINGHNPWDYDIIDLITLCNDCHKTWHSIFDNNPSDIVVELVNVYSKIESESIKLYLEK